MLSKPGGSAWGASLLSPLIGKERGVADLRQLAKMISVTACEIVFRRRAKLFANFCNSLRSLR